MSTYKSYKLITPKENRYFLPKEIIIVKNIDTASNAYDLIT